MILPSTARWRWTATLGRKCEMEVDCDIGQEITVYIETWFDVDKKFGTQLNGSVWKGQRGKRL